ncbi:MAG: NADH-quinone oxidoreductase subunit NuoE [Desulfobacterales bacterium]|nr:NADH-quinone oxidoreductase subunit NuoE [Desulfobacterales bacterium]MBS3755065.1 NADH-quinone oxidoreductase subunit NuoE [Desulfobacterales bacterium]
MLPEQIRAELEIRIAEADHPQELAVDVMLAFQEAAGYLSERALETAAAMLKMHSLEIEEIATFYTFIYREPVGRNVIHVCDSVICWLDGSESLMDYICRKLGIAPGQTTADGKFTLLPACCLGYCDRSPAMMINRKVYGHLSRDRIDDILARFEREEPA